MANVSAGKWHVEIEATNGGRVIVTATRGDEIGLMDIQPSDVQPFVDSVTTIASAKPAHQVGETVSYGLQVSGIVYSRRINDRSDDTELSIGTATIAPAP